MIQRAITEKVLELKDKYPVVSIVGPRQSGKTSLAKEIFPDYAYYNLENLDMLSLAQADPKRFLQIGSGTKMIIDEIQKFPDLLSYIQVEVDTKKIDGQFIITGSQNFAISAGISQSLAGRVANFTLLPLSYAELQTSRYASQFSQTKQSILRGFYPRPLVKSIAPSDFYRDYISTYVERDVRQIVNIGSLALFQKFLQLVAGRVGQLLNLSSLANDVGVTYKTIESWLSVLQASYIVYLLQPYHKNFGKRVIKSPKVYFYDVGLLCHLLRITSEQELGTHFAYGQIFENFVLIEQLKKSNNQRKNEQLYFWRDSSGSEVDIILDLGEKTRAIEVKSAQTFNTSMLTALSRWRKLDPTRNTLTTLVYSGEAEQLVNDHEIKNWQSFCGSTPPSP